MIILGIDPGTTRIGYGVIEKSGNNYEFIDAGLITTKNKKQGSKLIEINKKIISLVNKFNPEKAGVEKLFFSKNKKTALNVSEARGVIIYSLTKKSIPITEVSPNKAKTSVTGNGNASKDAVAKMVGYILNIDTNKYIDDTTDALAIAIAASD